MVRVIMTIILIAFVFFICAGLQLTSENFNSLLASDCTVFFRLVQENGVDYKFVILGEPFNISFRDFDLITNEVLAVWNKLIPSSGDAIINY